MCFLVRCSSLSSSTTTSPSKGPVRRLRLTDAWAVAASRPLAFDAVPALPGVSAASAASTSLVIVHQDAQPLSGSMPPAVRTGHPPTLPVPVPTLGSVPAAVETRVIRVSAAATSAAAFGGRPTSVRSPLPSRDLRNMGSTAVAGSGAAGARRTPVTPPLVAQAAAVAAAAAGPGKRPVSSRPPTMPTKMAVAAAVAAVSAGGRTTMAQRPASAGTGRR